MGIYAQLDKALDSDQALALSRGQLGPGHFLNDKVQYQPDKIVSTVQEVELLGKLTQ